MRTSIISQSTGITGVQYHSLLEIYKISNHLAEVYNSRIFVCRYILPTSHNITT